MKIPYKYSAIIIEVLLILSIPIILFVFSNNITSLISCFLLSCVISYTIIYKYGNTIEVDGSRFVVKNMLFLKKEYSLKEIHRISLSTEHSFLRDVVYINIRTGKNHKGFHIGTLSSKEIMTLYNYLNHNVDGHIEIM